MMCQAGAGRENAASGTSLLPPLKGKKCVTATMLAVFVAEHAPSAFPLVTTACFHGSWDLLLNQCSRGFRTAKPRWKWSRGGGSISGLNLNMKAATLKTI